jgi:hypothetical protein
LLLVHFAALVVFGLQTSYSSSSPHSIQAFYDYVQDSLQPAYVNLLILHEFETFLAVELLQTSYLIHSGNLEQWAAYFHLFNPDLSPFIKAADISSNI